ncbi:S8 family serine peptidase, partial [Candidatus Woesearchaeota archaeon]|nr:S8 family serine peptidase [Candidatus Woesearchaeota archaeon]
MQIDLLTSAPQINATKLWGLTYNGTNITGLGQTVCILDTGIQYTHPALGNCTNTTFLGGNCTKVLGGYDYVNTDWDPYDDNGHGTHVAGIVASMNDTYKGIANNASLIAIKVLNSAGTGSTANIIAGIDWCVNNASRYNITVISMSLGTSVLYTGYCDDSYASTAASINSAIAANISVFAATGNNGNTTAIVSPACIQNTTAVGAVNSNDAIFYNRNNITDVLAPGVSIISTYTTSGYATFSGTSMSTPHAAGAAALLRQYRKLETGASLTSLQVENALKTGKNITDSSGSNLNFTRIDLWPALASLDANAPIITFVGP